MKSMFTLVLTFFLLPLAYAGPGYVGGDIVPDFLQVVCTTEDLEYDEEAYFLDPKATEVLKAFESPNSLVFLKGEKDKIYRLRYIDRETRRSFGFRHYSNSKGTNDLDRDNFSIINVDMFEKVRWSAEVRGDSPQELIENIRILISKEDEDSLYQMTIALQPWDKYKQEDLIPVIWAKLDCFLY